MMSPWSTGVAIGAESGASRETVMNPFLHSTVALPMTGRPSSAGSRRMARRVLAGVALGLACLSAPAATVNVNAATASQLQEISGIGPKTAQVIIGERQRGGAYASMEDLSDRVKGIGPKKAARLAAAGLQVVPEASLDTALSAVPVSAARPDAAPKSGAEAGGDASGALSRLSGFLAR